MQMYKCNSCGKEFFQPKAIEEDRGEFWGIPCSETMYYCPYCEDDDFDEIEVDEDDEDFEEPFEYTEDDYYDSLIDELRAGGDEA